MMNCGLWWLMKLLLYKYGTVVSWMVCVFFTIKPGLHYFIAAAVVVVIIAAYARCPNRPFSHVLAKLFKKTSDYLGLLQVP